MYFHSISRRTAISILVAMMIMAIISFSLPRHDQDTSGDNVAGRAGYAQLYDAFWRADDGTDATLMTATMFTPSLIQSLEQAGEKTTTEQHILDEVQHQATSEVRFLVTLDSISGGFSDEAITKSLRGTVNSETVTASSWKPIIGNANVVNAPSGTASQRGIITFRFSQAIDWSKVQRVQLEMKGLLNAKNRSFVWSGAILLQATL